MTTITTPHGPSESRMLANAPVDRIGCPPHPRASPPMPQTRPPTAAGIGCSAATVVVHPSRWRGADYEQVLIVPITGSLDAATVPDFAAWLRPLASHGHHLVLDLSGLTFLGCAGLTLFVELHEDAAASTGSLQLVEVPSHPLRILQLTGLHTVLRVHADCAPLPARSQVMSRNPTTTTPPGPVRPPARPLIGVVAQERTWRTVLDSDRQIAMALGILMTRHHLDANAASAMLREQSLRTNTKLHDVAHRLLATAGGSAIAHAGAAAVVNPHGSK